MRRKEVRDVKDFERRFWSRVNKKTQDPSACWEWAGATRRRKNTGEREPGLLMVPMKDGTRKLRFAHRIALVLEDGELHGGEQVVQKCGNKRCVRPAHLSRRGSPDGHHSASLSPAQVEEIRRLYVPRPTREDLARRYGVSVSTIGRVLKTVAPAHGRQGYDETGNDRPDGRSTNGRTFPLSRAQIEEIRRLYAPRPTLEELSRRYGVGIKTVRRAVTSRREHERVDGSDGGRS